MANKRAQKITNVALPAIINSVDGIVPGVQVKNISLKQQKSGLKTTVTILLKDTQAGPRETGWFTKMSFLRNFSLKIVQYHTEAGHRRFLSDPVSKYNIIRSNRHQGYQEKIINVHDYLLKKHKSFALSEIKKYYTGNAQGKKRYQIPLEVSFEISNINATSMGVYVIPLLYSDTAARTSDTRVSKKYDLGKVKYELILHNGKTPKEAQMFVTENGMVYPGHGSVHYHPSQYPDPTGYSGYMAGVRHHKSGQPKLTMTNTPNLKIHDYRQLKVIDTIFNSIENNFKTKNNADTFNKLGLNQDEPEIAKKLHQVPNLPVSAIATSDGAYFSDLYLSRNSFDVPSMCFLFNKKTFVRDRTLFGDILANTGASTEGYCEIDTIKLLRRRVKVGINHRYIPAEHENDKEEIIAEVLRGPNRRDRINAPVSSETSKVGASISELPGFSNIADGIKYFSASDGSLSAFDGGQYQYGIEIVLQDNTSDYFKRVRRNLLSAVDKLNLFLETIKQADSFRRHAKTYDYDFVQNIMLAAPHRSAIKHLLRAMQELSGLRDTADRFDRIARFLVSISSPCSGTPDGIELIVELINNVINKINKLLEETKTNEAHITGAATNKAGSTRSKKPRKIKLKTFFSNNHYDANSSRGTGIDFLSVNAAGIGSSPGLRTVSATEYALRIQNEMKKYFTTDDFQTADSTNLTSDERNIQEQNFEQLEINKYSFLTPSIVRVDGQAPLENFHADSENFNKRRYNSALLNMHSVGRKIDPPVQKLKDEKIKVSSTDKKGRKNKISSNADNVFFNQLKENVSKKGMTVAVKNVKPKAFNFSVSNNKNENVGVNLNPIADVNIKDKKTVGEQTGTERANSKVNNILFDMVLKNEIIKKNSPNQVQSLDFFKLKNINVDNLSGSAGDLIKRDSGAKSIALALAPMQIKHLSFLDSNSSRVRGVNFKNRQLVDSEDYGYFYLNYKLIGKIEYISSHGVDKRGEIQVNNPRWSLLNTAAVEAANQGNQFVCRIRYYNNDVLKIIQTDSLRLPIYDQYFILGSEPTTIRRTRRNVNTNTVSMLRSVDRVEVNNMAQGYLVLPEDTFVNPDPKRILKYGQKRGMGMKKAPTVPTTISKAAKAAINIATVGTSTTGRIPGPSPDGGFGGSGGGMGGGGTTGGGGSGGGGGGY